MRLRRPNDFIHRSRERIITQEIIAKSPCVCKALNNTVDETRISEVIQSCHPRRDNFLGVLELIQRQHHARRLLQWRFHLNACLKRILRRAEKALKSNLPWKMSTSLPDSITCCFLRFPSTFDRSLRMAATRLAPMCSEERRRRRYLRCSSKIPTLWILPSSKSTPNVQGLTCSSKRG